MNLFRAGHSVCPVTAVFNYLRTIPSHLKSKGQSFFLNDKLQPLTRHYSCNNLKLCCNPWDWTIANWDTVIHLELGQIVVVVKQELKTI